MNVVELARLPKWVADGVRDCKECRNYPDGTAIVCGWHENLTAGARAVQALVEDDLLDGDR
jgi:succinylglutamate desuccinylase